MTMPQMSGEPESEPKMEEALVIGGTADNWVIQSDMGTFKATKAISCLVAPEIGDRVLCVSRVSGERSILAILERKASTAVLLKFAQDLNISASGSIRFTAAENLDIASRDKINLDTQELNQRATVARSIFSQFDITANEARQNYNKFQLMANYLEMVSDTSKQVMKNSFRMIASMESVSAGDLLHRISKRFTVQSRQASVLAEEDARVNAKRVHLG